MPENSLYLDYALLSVSIELSYCFNLFCLIKKKSNITHFYVKIRTKKLFDYFILYKPVSQIIVTICAVQLA